MMDAGHAPSDQCSISMVRAACAVMAAVLLGSPACALDSQPFPGQSLLQTGNTVNSSYAGTGSPVKKIVDLLKAMQTTLSSEMKDDEDLYNKLQCWCDENKDKRGKSESDNEAKVAELEATVESLGARSKELSSKVGQVKKETSELSDALAESTAAREKQKKEYRSEVEENKQGIDAVKDAVKIIDKHQGQSLVQEDLALLETRRKMHRIKMTMSRDDDDGAAENTDSDTPGADENTDDATPAESSKSSAPSVDVAKWPAADVAKVKRAVQLATKFLQAHNSQGASPSGSVEGALSPVKEMMETDLADAKETEKSAEANFEELSDAKSKEIAAGENKEERKENELASTDMNLAEANKDLTQTKAALDEDKKFLKVVETTCKKEGDNFETRKKTRMDEMTAVANALSILTGDDARDAMKGTFSFLEVSTHLKHKASAQLRKTAGVLRRLASRSHDAGITLLANSVQFDGVTKAKKTIDDMIVALQGQQDDEVVKKDWCDQKIQENELSIATKKEAAKDLKATVGETDSKVKRLDGEIAQAKDKITELQVQLQRASKNRKAESKDYQKIFEDQTMTISVLMKALDKLTKFYDKEFLQTTAKGRLLQNTPLSLIQKKAKTYATRQSPPVQFDNYKANKGSAGVMSLLESLISEAKELIQASRSAEGDAEAAYAETVENTFAAIENQQNEVTSKLQARAEAAKEQASTETEVSDSGAELDNLEKYGKQLHGDCDYILRNFGLRQEARQQEMDALKEAKRGLDNAPL